MSKVVRISEQNYQKIAQAGAFNESFDAVLSKLLEQAGKN
jgi:hypothetical protein